METIKEAIAQLSGPERLQLVEWFDELTDDEWDRQIEQDFSPGGRGYHLLDEVEADIAVGRTSPMEEFLIRAKAKREQAEIGK